MWSVLTCRVTSEAFCWLNSPRDSRRWAEIRGGRVGIPLLDRRRVKECARTFSHCPGMRRRSWHSGPERRWSDLGVRQGLCPREAGSEVDLARVTQLTKVQRPGCELGFFGTEQIPLPPHQAAAGLPVTTDEPQRMISSRRVCPPRPFLLHLTQKSNVELWAFHRIPYLWSVMGG